MKHRLDQEPDAGGHPWKKGKGRWRLSVLYIYLCSCILDSYAAEPCYLDILLYPVTLISYCLLLQHVRANKASLQTISVSSLVLPLHQLLRGDQQHRYRPQANKQSNKQTTCNKTKNMPNSNILKWLQKIEMSQVSYQSYCYINSSNKKY